VEIAVAPAQEAHATSSAQASPNLQTAALKGPKFIPFGPLVGPLAKEKDLEADEGLKASPYARKLAQEKGVDLSTVKGSGPGGRVIAEDVASAQPMNPWKVGFESKRNRQWPSGSFEYEALTPMRRTIATRLQESKTFIPHFYVSLSVEASALSDLQAQLKSQGLKISINDLMVRACALALVKNPKVNSGFDTVENKIIRFQTVDVCVAVALAEGLMTPVVYQADLKGLGQISSEVKSLVQRAQKGELQPYEYQGGSFTLSNLGMFAVDRFTAILNPPQAAILAVGGIIAKPIVKEGQVVAGKVMELTLSADHRVIDGADAARFLSDLKTLLESPAILLV
jgi:pyruvate dehydrogenase E2 component (dihydrolipoamide acetyltransferase)